MRRAFFALFLLAAGALAADEPAGDLKALQGTWNIHAATLAARDHIDDFAGMKLVVKGTDYTITLPGNDDKGALKLDETKSPKHIDLTTRKDGPFKGRNLAGIYKLDGDTVLLCLNSEKPERPSKFEAPAKTPFMLLTFQRDKK
jgi:uncharacterized protein (TIGR03067 family)